MVIECRGLEFTGFDPRVSCSSIPSLGMSAHPFQGIWKCVGTKGTVFSEAELVEGEWNDYDEKVESFKYFASCKVTDEAVG